jgi:hypothetical protein
MPMAKTLISRFSCFMAFLPAVGAAGPAFSYDASWYKATGWSGEYPNGFTMATDVTLNTRRSPDLDAPKSTSCVLRNGSTYHQWNKKRGVADQLEFISFTKIKTYEIKASFTGEVSRESGGRDITIEFNKGDRWSYLAYLAEGNFLIKFSDTMYVAGQDLYDESAEVEGPVKSDQSTYDEWLKLKCANGAVGWIFFNEIKNSPGFSKANIGGYGVASDLPSQHKSPAQGVTLSSPSPHRK